MDEHNTPTCLIFKDIFKGLVKTVQPSTPSEQHHLLIGEIGNQIYDCSPPCQDACHEIVYQNQK